MQFYFFDLKAPEKWLERYFWPNIIKHTFILQTYHMAAILDLVLKSESECKNIIIYYSLEPQLNVR